MGQSAEASYSSRRSRSCPSAAEMVWEGKLEKREQGVARLVRIGEVRD